MAEYVKIYCRKEKLKPDGTAPIVYRIALGGKVSEVASGKHIEPCSFDNIKQQVTQGGNKLKLNSFLQHDRHKLETIIIDLRMKGIDVTGEKVKAIFSGEESISSSSPSTQNDFILYWKDQMKYILKNRQQHEQGLRDIIKYAPNGLPFNRLSRTWLEQYRNHFISEGRKTNGFAHNFRSIRFFQLRAVEDKLMERSLFGKTGFKIETEDVEKEALTKDELERLHRLLIKNKDVPNWIRMTAKEKKDHALLPQDAITFSLKKTLYWFLLSVETALRFSDMLKVSRAMVSKKDNYYIRDSALFVKTAKTGALVRIPLTENALNLLKIDMPEPMKMHNNNVNNDLREICSHPDIAILRHITYHSSRHTFAIDSMNNGVHMKTISDVMGHKTTAITEKHYAKYSKYSKEAIDREINKKNGRSFLKEIGEKKNAEKERQLLEKELSVLQNKISDLMIRIQTL